MILKRSFLTSIVACIFFASITAQTNQVAYFMKIPQNHFMNPAIKPANRFYIGLPGISGISLSAGTDFLEVTDIIMTGVKSDTIITFQDPDFDLGQLVAKLKSKNTIMMDAGIQLFGLAFPLGQNATLSFDVTDRINAKIVFPKDLLDVYINGIDPFLNQSLNISEMNMKVQYFREYAAGISGNVTKNLRIGARVKYLSGLGSLSFNSNSLNINVGDDYSTTVHADAWVDVSGKANIQRIFTANNIAGGSGDPNFKGFAKEFLSPGKNNGLGFDFGAEYTLGKLFTLSASVTDLGYLTWKDDLKRYKANDMFMLDVISLSDVVDGNYGMDDFASRLVDTVKANFVEVNAPGSYRTYLPTTFNAGASLNVFKVLSLGVLSSTKYFAGQAKESLTLSANAYLGRVLSASASYTMANYSYNNLGFGLALKLGFAQFYVLADKIPVTWDKVYIKEDGTNNYKGYPMPTNWNMLNLQAGLNICFGKPVSKRADKPMVVEENK
ncbi:MAG: DUF5723 family protein [Bacteroidales bacterium]